MKFLLLLQKLNHFNLIKMEIPDISFFTAKCFVITSKFVCIIFFMSKIFTCVFPSHLLSESGWEKIANAKQEGTD